MTYRMAVSAFALAFVSMSSFAHTEGSNVEVPAPPPAGEASEATAAANRAIAERLPLEDQGDFEDASRGFLAAIDADPVALDPGLVDLTRNGVGLAGQRRDPEGMDDVGRAQLDAHLSLIHI